VTPYRDSLLDDLKDPIEAAEYLTAVLEDGDPEALALAVADVAQAQSLDLGPLKEETEALCRLKASLGKAGIQVTMRAA
jgi:hypothetical protein